MGWLDENTLSIQFADNTTDKIFLSLANNIPGLVVPCVFSGSLGRDLEAVVSVTGCKDTNVTACAIWETQGQCTETPAYMAKECPATCGICTNVCEDKETDCSNWAQVLCLHPNPRYLNPTL